jgi:hypothetical protein
LILECSSITDDAKEEMSITCIRRQIWKQLIGLKIIRTRANLQRISNETKGENAGSEDVTSSIWVFDDRRNPLVLVFYMKTAGKSDVSLSINPI